MRTGLCSFFCLLSLGCVMAPSAPPVVFGPQNGAEDLRGFRLDGTVQNLSDEVLHGLRVKLEFRDDAGNLVISRQTSVRPDPLPAGAQGRYSFQLEKRPVGMEIQMTAVWQPSS